MDTDRETLPGLLKLLGVILSAVIVVLAQAAARRGKRGEPEGTEPDAAPQQVASEPHRPGQPQPAPKRQPPGHKTPRRPSPRRTVHPRRSEPVISLRQVFLWLGFLLFGISVALWMLR